MSAAAKTVSFRINALPLPKVPFRARGLPFWKLDPRLGSNSLILFTNAQTQKMSCPVPGPEVITLAVMVKGNSH